MLLLSVSLLSSIICTKQKKAAPMFNNAVPTSTLSTMNAHITLIIRSALIKRPILKS